MLLPNVHRVRYISLGVLFFLLLLRVAKTRKADALTRNSPYQLRYRSITTAPRVHAFSDLGSSNDSGNETLPYHDNADSLAKKYQNYIVKGCKLWSLLQRQTDASGSLCTGANDLTNWAWQSTAPAGELDSESVDERLAQLFGTVQGPLAEKGIGITTNDGNGQHRDQAYRP